VEEAMKLTAELEATVGSLTIEETREAIRQAKDVKVEKEAEEAEARANFSVAGGKKVRGKKGKGKNQKAAAVAGKTTTAESSRDSSISSASANSKSNTTAGSAKTKNSKSKNISSSKPDSELERLQKEMRDMMATLASVTSAAEEARSKAAAQQAVVSVACILIQHLYRVLHTVERENPSSFSISIETPPVTSAIVIGCSYQHHLPFRPPPACHH
jgi:hypothetical protein